MSVKHAIVLAFLVSLLLIAGLEIGYTLGFNSGKVAGYQTCMEELSPQYQFQEWR